LATPMNLTGYVHPLMYQPKAIRAKKDKKLYYHQSIWISLNWDYIWLSNPETIFYVTELFTRRWWIKGLFINPIKKYWNPI